MPKRLRGFLVDRPAAVAALTRILIEEIERLLGAAAGVTSDAAAPAAARPRLGAISFLHRFGSALNHHVHLHVCAIEGVFVPPADGARCDAPPAFLPARSINQADLAALTERVRRRVIRWFRMQRLLDAAAAADMLTWENSGFSVDASVRITLIDRDVPSCFQSLEHLLRSSARPPFALERLSVSRGADGQIACIRYVLPRHKAANWVGPRGGGFGHVHHLLHEEHVEAEAARADGIAGLTRSSQERDSNARGAGRHHGPARLRILMPASIHRQALDRGTRSRPRFPRGTALAVTLRHRPVSTGLGRWFNGRGGVARVPA